MIKKFKCYWCFNEFEMEANYEPGEIKANRKIKHGKGNQIRCPKCFRFIEKFPKIKLENGSHIHFREN